MSTCRAARPVTATDHDFGTPLLNVAFAESAIAPGGSGTRREKLP
jgi:hypothetical protein